MKRFFSLFFTLGFFLGVFPKVGVRAEGRPKISIVMPVYNVEPWIRECMDSVINQTLRDIEVICVDDGSIDNSGLILDEYAASDNRVIVIHQKNQGVQTARNNGIERASGEYITFIDPDDYLNVNAYELSYNLAKKDDIDILEFDHRSFWDGKDDHWQETNFSDDRVLNLKEYWERCFGNYVWDKLFKAELIKRDNVKFVPGIRPADDTCFSYMVVGRANRFKRIPARLYNYRLREGALSRMSQEDMFKNSYGMFRYICDDWRDHGCLSGKEDLLLTKLLAWSAGYGDIRLKYADEILNSFGSDIYNSEVVAKCPHWAKWEIKNLENAAPSCKRQVIEDGIYNIVSGLNDRKVLDISGASTADGANLQLWDVNYTNAQKFEIKYSGSGYYTIKAKCSDKMIDVAMADQKSGTNVWQYPYNGTDAQKWYIVPCGNGSYNIISKCNLLAMDVDWAKTQNGTNVWCWYINGTKAQEFKFVKVG